MDESPLTGFIVPGTRLYNLISILAELFVVDAVERAAGLTFFSDEVKNGSKHICQSTKCEVIVRKFDDAQKNVKVVAAPRK